MHQHCVVVVLMTLHVQAHCCMVGLHFGTCWSKSYLLLGVVQHQVEGDDLSMAENELQCLVVEMVWLEYSVALVWITLL